MVDVCIPHRRRPLADHAALHPARPRHPAVAPPPPPRAARATAAPHHGRPLATRRRTGLRSGETDPSYPRFVVKT
jgi:hypothetical protein